MSCASTQSRHGISPATTAPTATPAIAAAPRRLSTIGLDAHFFPDPQQIGRVSDLTRPAVEAAGFRFTGYETRLLDVQSLVFVIALLLAFTEVVGPRGPRWRFVIPLLVVLAPSLADQLAAAEADIPLAAFFASAAGLAYLWHRERAPGSLALVGGMGLVAPLMRRER
jgi:hypothetical protein